MDSGTLIFGKGYIGGRLQEHLQCEITDKRINSVEDAVQEIEAHSPGTIINCIGFTGRNVDECEANPDKTIFSNSVVPLLLAEAAIKKGVKLVHISTGCIYHFGYGKDSPITEEKEPDFFGLIYSRSKIYSERALLSLSAKHNVLILRPRIPLDNIQHPKNLLSKLINYKKAIDVPNSVTYVPDFVKAVEHLIAIDAVGIFNTVNSGALYYPDLLELYKKKAPEFEFEVVKFKDLGLVRTNLELSTEKLEKTGFSVRPINDVLEECVEGFCSK